MTDIQEKFFQILRFTLGNSDVCPKVSTEEWRDIFTIAQQQCMSAVILNGIKSIKNGGPDEDTVMDWAGEANEIARQNELLCKNAVAVAGQFSRMGFESCLLKGQGNASMYPMPSTRTPGDIDIWLRGKPDEIIALIRKHYPKAKACYHHIDCPQFRGSDVEVHYRPAFMHNFLYNKRIQKFFADNSSSQFANKVKMAEGEIAIPTPVFNAVFQICHIYKHLFQEGIGLRQLTDYYYLLTTNDFPKNTDYNKLFSRLGLRKISGAITWILEKQMGMDHKYALTEGDEKRGRFVLAEILAGGNFGIYDQRHNFGESAAGHNINRLWRDIRLIRLFPSESLSEPFFRMWHVTWRMRH